MHQTKPLETLPKDRNKMYLHWVSVGMNFSCTARKFTKSLAVVRRMADKDRWHERAEYIECKVMRELDQIIIKDQLSNLTIVKALKVKALSVLLKKFKKHLVNVTIRDVMAMLEYEDRLLGNIPPDSQNVVTNIFNGTNGADADTIDRNLGAYFTAGGKGNGSAIKVDSPESRLPKDV